MEIKNLYLETKVALDGYFGDWQTALDEAKFLTEKFEMPVCVTYANQYRWVITKDTDVEELKKQIVVIGL